MRKIKLQKIVGNLLDKLRRSSKIVHEWNGYLEILSRPQVIENPRQYLLLRTDILQKTVVVPLVRGRKCLLPASIVPQNVIQGYKNETEVPLPPTVTVLRQKKCLNVALSKKCLLLHWRG